jgi:hypothetical protein
LKVMAVQKIGITNANREVNEEHHIPILLCSRPLLALERSRRSNL